MKTSTLLFRSLAVLILITSTAHIFRYSSQVNKSVEKHHYAPDMDYLIGKWGVVYNDENFKGTVVYSIKKEGNVLNGHTDSYRDENKYSEKAEGNKVLIIKKFDGHSGSGTYLFEHEQEEYNVDCQIEMVNENTFSLSYDYYGYSEAIIWKREKL